MATNQTDFTTGNDNTYAVQSESLLLSALSNITSNASTSSFNITTMDSSIITSDLDLLILTNSYHWSSTRSIIDSNAQTAIVNFVNNGGAVLTAEWMMWGAASNSMQILEPIFPVNPTDPWVSRTQLKFIKVTHDPVVSDGLPNDWTFTPTDISGVETFFTEPRSGTTVFYNSAPTA